jgi:hypothetical protein
MTTVAINHISINHISINHISINHISLRAKSTLNILSEICAICREHVCDKCTKCANGEPTNNNHKTCFSVLGECNHAYHQCCIQGWAGTIPSISQKCPMCSKNWAIKKRSIKSDKTNYKDFAKNKKVSSIKDYDNNNNYDHDDSEVDEDD